MAHAFDGLGAHRVEFKADALNLRLQAALEAIGATREGTLAGTSSWPTAASATPSTSA